MRKGERPYLAYLLRLWRVSEEGQTGWRASVENAHTGEQRAFAGLAALFSFLENEVGIGQPEALAGEGGGSAEKEDSDGVARVQDNGAYGWPET